MSPSVDPDPAYIQRNVESLLKIGGVYDFVAAVLEARHQDLLRKYRLDTGAKTMVELLEERGQ